MDSASVHRYQDSSVPTQQKEFKINNEGEGKDIGGSV
jgi:hypothetical protein